MKLWRQARIRQALCGLFLAEPKAQWYAIDLWKATGVSIGGLYVALARMEHDGWIESDWVDGPYPRRRMYWPTDLGIERMQLELLNANWVGRKRTGATTGS